MAPVIGLAAAQRLGCLGAADELADLQSSGRKHRDLVVLWASRELRDKLDDADHLARIDHWQRERRVEAS